MKLQFNIQLRDGTIWVTGPYSEDNNKCWRELGGKFSAGAWRIPDTPVAREKIADLFGEKSDEVDVLVPAEEVGDGQIVQIGGYVLASRRGRDARVQMPDGVCLESGTFYDSGGSVKHPRVRLDADMVFRLRCRKSFAESWKLELAPESSTSGIEI